MSKFAAITTPAQRAKTVYVSGPMSGHEDLNFPAFNAAAAALRAQGFNVTNPADHGVVTGVEWADYLRADLAQLSACEAIYLLPGWSKSKGARLKLHVAQALGMQITLAEGAEPLELAAPLVGQQEVQPWDYPFFSHDNEGGTEFHKTEAEAIKWCEEALQVFREEAGDGWAEEVESLSWGVVIGRAVKCDEKPASEGSGFDYMCDYSLQSATHPSQQGLEQDASRWREALKHVGADNILGGAQYVFRGRAPMNVMRGSVAEHFTKTIDEAIAAQAKQGGV